MTDREILELYTQGYSISRIAEPNNLSWRYVRKVILAAGIMRNLSDAHESSNLPKSDIPDNGRWRARYKWRKHKGPIPEGYQIHHKDGNTSNNDFSNLACLPTGDHQRLHKCGPEYGIPYHLRPKRRAYTQQYMKPYNKEYRQRIRAAKQT